MKRLSREYAATIRDVKKGLRAIGYSQNRAAQESYQSGGLISGVLNRKVKSQPCLERLAALINARLREREQRRATVNQEGVHV